MFDEEVRSFNQIFSLRSQDAFRMCSSLTSIVDHLVVYELYSPLILLVVQPEIPEYLHRSLN